VTHDRGTNGEKKKMTAKIVRKKRGREMKAQLPGKEESTRWRDGERTRECRRRRKNKKSFSRWGGADKAGERMGLWGRVEVARAGEKRQEERGEIDLPFH